jgi:uncharacterized protein YlxP (DUF503 family)
MSAMGILHLKLAIPQAQSLKTKRQIIKSLKDVLRRKFNVSVAEVDDLDKWQRAEVAVACIGNDKRFLNSVLSKVVNVVEKRHEIELIDYEIEIA